MNIEHFIKQSTNNASKIKLRGGLVGKVSQTVITAVIAIASVAGLSKSPSFCYVAAVVILVLVLVPLWWLIRLASKHPDVAILEGAEFLVYQQMEMAQKGVGILPQSPAVPSDPTLPSPEEIKTAMMPDTDPASLPDKSEL